MPYITRVMRPILYNGRFYQIGDSIPAPVSLQQLEAWKENGVIKSEPIQEESKGRAAIEPTPDEATHGERQAKGKR